MKIQPEDAPAFPQNTKMKLPTGGNLSVSPPSIIKAQLTVSAGINHTSARKLETGLIKLSAE